MYESLAYIACRQSVSLQEAWERYKEISRSCPACRYEDFKKYYLKVKNKFSLN